jgi:predicted N-acetyltransferase YhbS
LDASRIPAGPDGLVLPGRVTARAAVVGDVPAITALVAACETVNDGVAEIHPNDVSILFDPERPDPGEIVVVEDGSAVVAWAHCSGERAEADVHPEWQGLGIGMSLLAWTEARARAAGRSRVRQTVTDANIAAASLFRASGYASAGASWILQQGLGDEPPAVEIPDGITIRPYRPSDARAVHRLIDDAFNEWPGREPVDFEHWAPHVIRHGSFAPDLSRLAFDGEELVGAALGFAYEGGDEGWIQQLATKSTHRHRGIARALLQSAFAGFHAAGWRACGLSTDSRTGALTLYERVGMRVRRSYTWWVKPLA